jgi:DNA-binding transcriptional ArsR family regulator
MRYGLGEVARERIEYELRGKTLSVYMYLLKNGSAVGVREVQKALGFSSPSVAFHHLDKLVSLGVVEKDQYDRYVLSKAWVLRRLLHDAGRHLPHYKPRLAQRLRCNRLPGRVCSLLVRDMASLEEKAVLRNRTKYALEGDSLHER